LSPDVGDAGDPSGSDLRISRGSSGRPPPPTPLPCEGEGSVRVLDGANGWRSRRGRGEGCGPLRGDGEGHVVTGVCGRGRWLLQAQVAFPGCVPALPRPAHAPVGDRLRPVKNT
jgi:hypothetical protein